MSHVVLLGDSVFDNAAYVGDGPDVIAQLQRRLPEGWEATLCAVDGAVTSGVEAQLARLPEGSTHLVISAGGNDALNHVGIIDEGARSSAEVLNKLAGLSERFRQGYSRMLKAALRRRLPTAVCTIYYPRFTDPDLKRLAVTGLSLFNDAIIIEAFQSGVPLLDLRLICNEPSDYANAIEPSVAGGEKIAGAIIRVLTEHDFSRRRTEAFITHGLSN
jgi:hypothetical protein